MPIHTKTTDSIKFDVPVIGGGAAGIAAAVTAARQGLKVVLVDRYGFCGGGAVAGLSGTVCGLYLATDRPAAKPEQILFGMAEEFCTELERRGGLTPPVLYSKPWTRVHEPLARRDTADAILLAADVQIIYHAVAAVLLEGGERVEGVQIWTKQGTLIVRAGVTIDASGTRIWWPWRASAASSATMGPCRTQP
jgi:flavin-dependent dehydrogenase